MSQLNTSYLLARDGPFRSSIAIALVAVLACYAMSVAEDKPDRFPHIYNSQREELALATPQAALQGVTLPAGFHASMFAAEPDVQQPIALATDERGRLWVAENYTYAEREKNYDKQLRDRIVILDDVDGDGQFDHRTVFWDDAVQLTSIEIGFGGVWALCSPNLLFIPDRNRDDVPDGEPVVLLDGWEGDAIRHNIVNGLRWGPDGWLYGRHGIQATSLVGTPGTQPEHRTKVDCAIWRYHPTRKTFEVVCRGTTNPWGMDWDDHGQMFFINTVIGHLWHVVPGAFYQRMYGEHFDADLYELISQTADHYHWDTRESWSDIKQLGVTGTTDEAGGGHAHCGMLIYLGDNWPGEYRGRLLTANLHGRRINQDRLERHGATYVGRHEPDLMKVADPWFRGIELLGGADGGVFIADWSDIGECHENDGVHRTSGRIYKVTHAGQGRGGGATGPVAEPTPADRPPTFDLASLTDAELVDLQRHENDWHVRQSRRLLQERAAESRDFSQVHRQLRTLYRDSTEPTRQLRAMWCLYATRGASGDWLRRQLDAESEHVRAWAVQLLVDDVGIPSPETRTALKQLAARESSGLVLTFLASALRRFPPQQRWELAGRLAERAELANDRVFPLMLWYGVLPAVADRPEQAVELVGRTPIRKLRQFVARRLTEEIERQPQAAQALVALLAEKSDRDFRLDVLRGMSTALRGWRSAAPPTGWETVSKQLGGDDDNEVRMLARELAVVFGDGRATDELRALAASNQAAADERRAAIAALVDARTEGLANLLQTLLSNRDLAADAVRGLAAYDHPATPDLLIAAFGGFRQPAREAAIAVLVSRIAYARALLDAVAAGKLDRAHVSAFQLRQLQTFGDSQINARVAELWPELQQIAADKLAAIVAYRDALTPAQLQSANVAVGRALFDRSCAKCHKLFGNGGAIGPELTGAQRNNLNYLLENIVDPSATVSKNFNVSTVITDDGRVISGVVQEANERTLTVQTPTDRVILARDEIEEILPSQLSMMPDRLLDVLEPDQVRDLIAYLMSPQQVAPATVESPEHNAGAQRADGE